jgi:arylsulfatase
VKITDAKQGRLFKVMVGACSALLSVVGTADAKDIIHDAEHYVLKAQHGDKWNAQDVELDKKLKALRDKYGTPPNIIHIMWDDTGVGEIGIPEIQKMRGFETPNMNQFAAEGAFFTRMYTEPSCTPSRAAVMTGRHAKRNGMYNVGFPYEYGGLAKDEVTMAEVLGKEGYATAFYGKSHLGDVESSYLNRQGFDEAFWTPYNQVPSMYTPRGQIAALQAGTIHPELYPKDPYDIDPNWRVNGYVWALEGKKGGPVREWGTPPNEDDYHEMDRESERRTLAFVKKNADAKKPFYIAYWPQATHFLGIDHAKDNFRTNSAGMLQEALVRIDDFVAVLEKELKAAGIAENTLIILMADNGPMTHNGPAGMVETLYRGGKGDFTEGGVRVAALAKWPGVIAPGTIVGDIIHETDLFTTFARLGGAMKHIPRDRIIDGVDQTAVFLEGDTHSRRDYVHIYTGDELAATVKGRYKRRWAGAQKGLSGPEFHDLYNDPREVQGQMLPGFPTKGMFNMMKARHQLWMEKYPNVGQNRDWPLQGIENARPETKAAGKPRIDPSDLPFDPDDVLRNLPEFDNVDAGWGAGER